MKLCFTYGVDALMLPVQIIGHVDKASKKDIKVLLSLAAEPTARLDLSAGCRIVAERLSLSEREVEASLSFWRGAGVIELTDAKETAEVVESAPASVVKEKPAMAEISPVEAPKKLRGTDSTSAQGQDTTRKISARWNHSPQPPTNRGGSTASTVAASTTQGV